MRKATRLVKRLVIALGLLAVAIVLFPSYTQPLWEGARVTTAAIGYDAFPSFGAAEVLAGQILLVLVLVGAVYILWRDRRLEVLEAEYAQQTGAKQLKQKVRDLETQLGKITKDCDAWQEKCATLNEQYNAALVAAKEYEVRSQYGSEDREELRELRKRFEEVLKEKGNTEGFRAVLDLILKDLSQSQDGPTVSVHSSSAKVKKEEKNPWEQEALPYAH